MPVPSNASCGCSRWKTPNSLLEYFISKPTPLSRTNNTASPSILPSASDLDFRLRTRAGELYGVGNQVDESHSQHGAVSIARRQWIECPLNVAPLCILTHIGHNFLNDLTQVNERFLGLGAADSRKGQQIVDQTAHSTCRFQDHGEVPQALLIERCSGIFPEKFGKARHMAKRCAQVMRDRVGKGFQFLVAGLERESTVAQVPG